MTRADAVPIADAEARQIGIPVDSAWTVLSWANSSLLDEATELAKIMASSRKSAAESLKTKPNGKSAIGNHKSAMTYG